MLFSNLDPYHLFILTFERPFWSRLQNHFELLSDHRVILFQHAGHGQELQRILPHRAVDQGRTGIVIHVETHLKRNRLSCWLIGWFKGTFWGNHGLSWSCPDQMEIGGGFSNHFLQQSLRPLRPWAHPKTQKKQRAGASILTNAAPPTKLADANPSNCGHIHHKPAGFNPSEKIKVSWDDYSQHMEK